MDAAGALFVPGARVSNALTDLALCMELWGFLYLWLRERPSKAFAQKHALFTVYAWNLFGAALWCSLGVYLHVFEPLPTRQTPAWLVFLLLGAVTPVLFPVVVLRAFYEVSENTMKMHRLVAGAAFLCYTLVAATGVDLVGGRPLPLLWLTPWHAMDGRSYAGEPLGLQFDLLSTMPCAKGNSNFVLSTIFLASNALCVVLLIPAGWGKLLAAEDTRRGIAQSMAIAVGIMFINCQMLAFLIVVVGASVGTAIDIFHVVQGVIMALGFWNLSFVLRHMGPKVA